MAAKKKVARKSRARNGVAIGKTLTKTIPWWAFLPQNYEMCSVPDSVRHAKSPQEAWDACDTEELIWALDNAGVKHKFGDGWNNETQEELSAEDIRKRFPSPPAAMLRLMERWLKAPPSDEDERFRPERY